MKLSKKNYDKYYNNKNLSNFVSCINKIILEKEMDFNLFQNVLHYLLFSNIYSKFKSSDILIEARIKEKINSIYWLVPLYIAVNLTGRNEKSTTIYLVDLRNSKKHEFLLCKGANVNLINKSFELAISILL